MDTAAVLAPFAPVDRGVDEPDPVRAALRAAGPVVRVDAPAGGSAWIVTDEAVARAALVDPRITKDPAWAPTAWDPQVAGVEPPAAVQPFLTTLDGPAHAALRQAHAPLFTARRLRAHHGRMTGLARELLTAVAGEDPVDLAADFTARYPVAARTAHPLAVHHRGGRDRRRAPAAACTRARRHPRDRHRPAAAGRTGPDVRRRSSLLPRRPAGRTGAAGRRCGRPQRVPDARLAVPRSALRQVGFGGIGGSRLVALPVVLGRSRSGPER